VPIATIHVLEGRYDEARLALLKELNAQVVERAGISPDDLLIQLSEGPGENYSFGQGLAQRAFISAGTGGDGDVLITSASANGEP
jgi:phenylpyruvate tautomerase PptA (4-oxalocrotonate tautomerase family)